MQQLRRRPPKRKLLSQCQRKAISKTAISKTAISKWQVAISRTNDAPTLQWNTNLLMLGGLANCQLLFAKCFLVHFGKVHAVGELQAGNLARMKMDFQISLQNCDVDR